MIIKTQFLKKVNTSSQSFGGEKIILLSTILLLSITLASPGIGENWAPFAIIVFFFAALYFKTTCAIHLALFVLLLIFPLYFAPKALFRSWPQFLLIPLLIYGLISSMIPKLRQSIDWLSLGSITPPVIRLIILCCIVSGIALITWVIAFRPNLEQHLSMIPGLPFWTFPLLGIGFALLNAAMEEAVFRGIVMEAAERALGSEIASVMIQAIPFATLHYLSGFPKGISGLFMTFVYGIMLGIIRLKSKGMLAPFITHVVADLTIFLILTVMIVL